MISISIAREYTWEMGHALWKHQGKCFNPHGHNYRMEVEVSGPVDKESGMIMDFERLDGIVDSEIRDHDHQFAMNQADERYRAADLHPDCGCHFEILEMSYEPTAENLALRFFNFIEGRLEPGSLILERVTLYETDRARATVRRS